MSVLLPLKAEVVLGASLAARHRTAKLAAALALLVVGVGLSGAGGVHAVRADTVFAIAGSLAAVAGSRLLARGTALTSARRAAGVWWLAPVGRLSGALALVAPLVWLSAGAMGEPAGAAAAVRLGAVAFTQAAALGALTAAAAPLLGASAAGTLGVLAAWFGGLSPSGILELFAELPLVQRPLVLAWNVLPLSWRGLDWLNGSGLAHGLVLIGWLPAAVLLAAWTVSRPLGGGAWDTRPGSLL